MLHNSLENLKKKHVVQLVANDEGNPVIPT